MSKPQYVHKLLLYIRFLLYNVTNPGIHMYRRHLDLFPLYSSVAAPTPMPSMPKRFPRSSMSSISFSRAKNSISTGTRTIPARFSSRGGAGTSRLPSASSGELKDNLASSSKFDTRKKFRYSFHSFVDHRNYYTTTEDFETAYDTDDESSSNAIASGLPKRYGRR